MDKARVFGHEGRKGGPLGIKLAGVLQKSEAISMVFVNSLTDRLRAGGPARIGL
jgi:hypothetical protein